MEHDSADIRYTVILTGLTDEASKAVVAGALSRLGGLPVDRVSLRLESLPWTLLKGAGRSKAVRLVALLQKLSVEFSVIPPLQLADSSEQPVSPIARPEAAPEDIASVSSVRRSSDAAANALPSQQADEAEPRKFAYESPWQRSTEPAPQTPAEPATGAHIAIEPLPLDGVLDPAFQRERADSWLSAIVLVPWYVLAGTLQSLSATLDRSFDICKAHFWRLLAIAGVPWILVAGVALIAIVGSLVTGLTAKSFLDLPLPVLVIGVIAAIPTVLVGGALFLFLPHAALVHAISEIYLGRDIEVVEAYRFAFTKMVRYILTSYLVMLVTMGLFIVAGLAAIVVVVPLLVMLGLVGNPRSPAWVLIIGMIGFTAFLVPLVICLPRLFFFDKVLMIEDIAYGESLKRSWRLLSGRSGKPWYTSYYWIFGILLVVLIPLHWGIMGLFEGPALIISHLMPLPKAFGTYAGQVVSTFGNLLAEIYSVAVGVLFYYTLRSRKEGHDLLALAQTDPEKPWNGIGTR